MQMKQLNERSVAILQALHETRPKTTERHESYLKLAKQYSGKGIMRKLAELRRRGYVASDKFHESILTHYGANRLTHERG